MPEISIIVPVYHCEAYLPACIESILRQTFSDFELILVDDGSKDQSCEICDRYAASDKRIRVVRQENSGVSAARNHGIKLAVGKYLTFADSDDYLDANALQIMRDAMEADPALDCAAAGIRYVYEGTGTCVDKVLPDVTVENEADFQRSYVSVFQAFGFHAVYAKLYRAALIKTNAVFFDERFRILEDGIFVSTYLGVCRKYRFLGEVVYNYRQSDHVSLMKKFNENAHEAMQQKYDCERWMRQALEGQALRYYYRKWISLWIDFSSQIYTRSALPPKEKKRLLTELVQAAFLREICDAYDPASDTETLSWKKRVLMNLLKHHRITLLHWMLSLKHGGR